MSTAPSSLIRPQVRSWSWALTGQATQLAGQAGAFLLLARALPVGDMGIFVAATAFTSILAPFTSMGAGNLLIKYVARDRAAFADRWTNLLGTTLLTGCLLCLVAVPVCRVILPLAVPWYVIAPLVIADLLFWRWPYLLGFTLQGLGEINRKSQIEMFAVSTRLAAAVLMLALPKSQHQVRSWVLIYFAVAGITGAACLLWSMRKLGKPKEIRWPMLKDLKEGLWFVVSPSTQTINNDADKLLLARMASLSTAGMYGAAYRVLSASFLPVQALLTVTYPQFFQHGSKGLRQSARYAVRWLPIGLAYSLTAGLLIFAAAPLVAKILGPDYAQSATVLRQLAVLPLIKTFQYFLADALTGADYQLLRVGLQCAVAGLNVLLNIFWIPRFGWEGAVWATLVSDGCLALVLMATVAKLRN